MRIIRVDTQEGYDNLMEELQSQGYKWTSGKDPTTVRLHWNTISNDMVIIIEKMELGLASLCWAKEHYPNVEIELYKPKPKSNKVYCVVGTNRILKQETIIALFSTVDGASNFIKNDEYLFCLYDLDVKVWGVLD